MKINSNSELKALISASNSGKKIPALRLIEDSPATAAILSKLNNVDRETKYDGKGNRTIVSPNSSGMSDLSQDVAQKATDNENTLQLFPELEQALRILINSVLAPKDLNNTDIIFSIPNDLKVSPLNNKLLPIIEKKLSKDFKLKQMIPEMLYKTLGVDGAYPVLIIPESSVDDMINDRKTISTESIQSLFGDGKDRHISFGFIGDNDEAKTKGDKTVGFESFVSGVDIKAGHISDNKIQFKVKPDGANVDTLIRVTDNIDLIKFPDLIKKKRNQQVNKTLEERFVGSGFRGNIKAIATESDINNHNQSYSSTELNDLQLTQLLYKNNVSLRNVTRKVKTSNQTDRLNIGAPLVKILSAECVMPVCMSGNKDKHVGFYILLDGMGNHLSKDSASSVYDDFRRNQRGVKQGGGNLSSSLLQRTADAFSTSCDIVTYQQMQKICGEIIESDLLARLRNGIYGEDVSIVENTVVYDIMLSRMFREQQTQILFVPVELMSYFHHKLRKNGTGKTLLEDSLVLNSLRAVLMFANINRAVINSIGRTEIELTVDEHDPNKAKTLEIAKHEALRTRQSQAIPATISPTDIQHYLNTSQMHFNITAVPGLPGTSMKFNETQTSYAQPESNMVEQLDKKAIMALGVPPELVANNDVEFATNIVSNNLRLNKQIVQIQEAFQPQLSTFARTFVLNHGDAIKEIENVIRDNIKTLTETANPDEFFAEFADNQDLLVRLLARECLSNFEVNFSRPDTVTLKNQMETFTEFEEALDKVLKYRLSEDILSEATSGEITSQQIGLIYNSVKAYYVRDWLKKNAIMPELFDIVTDGDDNKTNLNIFTESSAYASSLTESLNGFLKRVIPVAEASERDMQKLTGGQELEAGPGSSEGNGGSSSSSLDDGGSGDVNLNETGGDDSGDGGGEDDLIGGMPEMPSLDSL
jgi:hypothetical protein